MSLRDRLSRVATGAPDDGFFERFGVVENPYPAASQTSDNPHLRTELDDEIEIRIESFVRDGRTQVVVVVGSQGTGKTNILNHFEREIREALDPGNGFYIVRYLSDPEATFDGILRRLFQELGEEHLERLGESLATDDSAIDGARSHEVRVALRALAREQGSPDAVKALQEWFLGVRLLKFHKEILGVNFRLDTVESRTSALRDLIQVSSLAGLLKGIFLLLDELEKQDGVLSATAVVRYLSAMRAIIDALPNHLFMMLALTPDALRRYSSALPAFRSRLENRVEIQPLMTYGEARMLDDFYLTTARQRAERLRGSPAQPVERIISERQVRTIFDDLLARAQKRADEGVKQREFLHALHVRAEEILHG